MVKIGIIGAGRLGNVHASHLALMPDVKIAGVYDIKPEAAQAMHDKYGAKICKSATELAGSPDIDGVIVTSPTYCHLEGIKAAVAADKHVFCEKPLTRTLEDAKEALALLKGYPKLFTVGFVRRYMAKSLKVKQLLAEGLIGKVRYCNIDLPFGAYRRMYGDWFADFDKSGGVIVDMLAHHADLANWYFGEADSVYAAGMLLDRTQELPSDYAAAVVRYKNGVICNLMCAWQRFGRSNEQMEIYGEKGSLTMDGTDSIAFHPLGGEKRLIEVNVAADKAGGVEQVNVADGFQIEAERFVKAVAGGSREGMPTAQDGFLSLALGIAMIKSAQTNQVVKFPLKHVM